MDYDEIKGLLGYEGVKEASNILLFKIVILGLSDYFLKGHDAFKEVTFEAWEDLYDDYLCSDMNIMESFESILKSVLNYDLKLSTKYSAEAEEGD